MFEPTMFRKRMYCGEESACETVGIFGVPAVIRRQGNCAPLAPLVTPLIVFVLLNHICYYPTKISYMH